MIVDTNPSGRVLVNRLTGPLAADVMEWLSVALPSIPHRVLQYRIPLSLTDLIKGMSDVTALETPPFGGISTPGSLETAEHFLQYIERIFRTDDMSMMVSTEFRPPRDSNPASL